MNRNTIKIVRFKNGDTLICGIGFTESDNFYLIEQPMQISMMPIVTKKGVEKMSIYMQEWLEYTKETIFKIPSDVIMLIATPEDEMVDEYMDALEKTELHRIQRDFENISKNYDNPEETNGNSHQTDYNKIDELYDEEYEDEYDDEDDLEEEQPD
jgi:hypothetical protein